MAFIAFFNVNAQSWADKIVIYQISTEGDFENSIPPSKLREIAFNPTVISDSSKVQELIRDLQLNEQDVKNGIGSLGDSLIPMWIDNRILIDFYSGTQIVFIIEVDCFGNQRFNGIAPSKEREYLVTEHLKNEVLSIAEELLRENTESMFYLY